MQPRPNAFRQTAQHRYFRHMRGQSPDKRPSMARRPRPWASCTRIWPKAKTSLTGGSKCIRVRSRCNNFQTAIGQGALELQSLGGGRRKPAVPFLRSGQDHGHCLRCMATRCPAGDCAAIAERGKLHDDLCDLGEDISPNRAWRLARLAGIRAQIGYKEKPGSYGGSPAVVADNALNWEFDVDAPDQFCLSAIDDNRLPVAGHRHHLHPHPRRLPVSCRRDRSFFAACCWVVHARPHLYRPAVASAAPSHGLKANRCRAADGCLAAQTKDQSSGAFPLSCIAAQYPAGQRIKAHNSPATSGKNSSNSTI